MAEEHKPANKDTAAHGPRATAKAAGKSEPSAEKTYMLRKGHQTTFRRTVKLDGSKQAKGTSEDAKVQLVLEPGQDYKFSEVEIEGVRDLIDAGLLVEAEKDEKGRLREVSSPRTDADSVIDRLEAKVDEQAAEITELKTALKHAEAGRKTGG